MPKKPITWIGSAIILGAGIFCWWALIQYRNDNATIGTQFNLLTAAAIFTPVVAAVAIFLWYYFNERA